MRKSNGIKKRRKKREREREKDKKKKEKRKKEKEKEKEDGGYTYTAGTSAKKGKGFAFSRLELAADDDTSVSCWSPSVANCWPLRSAAQRCQIEQSVIPVYSVVCIAYSIGVFLCM